MTTPTTTTTYVNNILGPSYTYSPLLPRPWQPSHAQYVLTVWPDLPRRRRLRLRGSGDGSGSSLVVVVVVVVVVVAQVVGVGNVVVEVSLSIPEASDGNGIESSNFRFQGHRSLQLSTRS